MLEVDEKGGEEGGGGGGVKQFLFQNGLSHVVGAFIQAL